MISELDGGDQLHASAALSPGYPLDWRLGGLQNRSGRCRESNPGAITTELLQSLTRAVDEDKRSASHFGLFTPRKKRPYPRPGLDIAKEEAVPLPVM
jgi:hypothetical protein